MMSFDGGFEFLGGLVGLALLRSGEQSIHGDLGLLGQVQRLVKRIGWFSGNDVVRGKHDGCGALTLGIVGACVPIGESGKHGRAAHHAIANQRSGLLTVLRAFQPVGNRLIIAVLHLVDIVLGLDACEDAAGFAKLFGHQFVVVGQRKNGT